MSKATQKETLKFIVQLIAAIASAILTALGATSCYLFFLPKFF